MYKYLIIGIALMFALAGSYYINKSGGELIVNAITGEKPTTLAPLNSAAIPGVYVCDTKSGCTGKYVLLLKNDQTAVMRLLPQTDTPLEENTESNQEENLGTENSSTTESSNKNISPVSNDVENATSQAETETPLQNDAEFSNEEFESSDTLDPDSENNDGDSGYIIDRGTWDVVIQNMLVITLITQGTTTYDTPQKIVIKNVDPMRLSKISFTKTIYPNMVQPTFIRQE